MRVFLSKDVSFLLMNALVLSKLDYCNSLLANVPKSTLRPLQVAQNDAARVVFNKTRRTSASSLLHELHWLPIEKRIQYKICTFVFKALHCEAPQYVSEMLNVYIPARNLRSKSKNVLVKPKMKRKIGERSFQFSAPMFWNSLPCHVKESTKTDIFKKRLKTHLF